MSITPAFEAALRQATDKVLGDMVVGISMLLDQYPQGVGN